MLDGLAWNFVTDLMTIAAVMTVVFWDVSAALILLVPSVFPVLVVFGLMGWLGVLIDVGTIMTPTVALGVSVDDVVHFLIWYRRGLAEGRDRKGAIMLAYEGCARAMYQSWAVLGLGLAVFSLSSFVPTQRFGAMMFCLLTAALVGNLLMMPAVLASPLASLFGRRLVRRAQRERAVQEKNPVLERLSEGFIDQAHPSPPNLRHDPSHAPMRSLGSPHVAISRGHQGTHVPRSSRAPLESRAGLCYDLGSTSPLRTFWGVFPRHPGRDSLHPVYQPEACRTKRKVPPQKTASGVSTENGH